MRKHYISGVRCTECDCTVPEGERFYETVLGERVCVECLEAMTVCEFISFLGESLTVVEAPVEA